MRKKPSPSGLVYLAISGLSGYFLVWYGTWALLAAVAVEALGNLAKPEQPRPVDVSDLANTGAIMASMGLCLTMYFLGLGLRRLAGKLAGNSIKGTMSATSTGRSLGTVEWVRKVRP